jgi:hypothetical protein
MKISSKRWLVAAAVVAIVAAIAAISGTALAGSKDAPKSASGLGQLTGLLPRDHLTVESAIQVDLSKESVRLPLYKGRANGQTVWFVLLDASDQGIAHDLGVNYAPKLSNIAIGDPEAVQTVTLDSPTPDQNKFGQAVVNFQGAPDFSPTRIAEPGPNGFPLANFQPGAVAGPGYSPFIRIAGSQTVYSAPIATRARASSAVSRSAPASIVSPFSRKPAGSVQRPSRGSIARLHSRTRPSHSGRQPTTVLGFW